MIDVSILASKKIYELEEEVSIYTPNTQCTLFTTEKCTYSTKMNDVHHVIEQLSLLVASSSPSYNT
jgi:hypothetical protein